MTQPLQYEYYQHRDGGLYNVLQVDATSTVDGSSNVVYAHVWPFESKVWIRPAEEWTPDRFRHLSDIDEVKAIIAIPREELQSVITRNKAERKSKVPGHPG